MDSFFQSPEPEPTGISGANSTGDMELSPEALPRIMRILPGESLRKSFPKRTIRAFSAPGDGLFLGFFRSRDSGRKENVSAVTDSREFYFAEAPFSCPADISLFRPDILLEISESSAASVNLSFSPECPGHLREEFLKALREEPEFPESGNPLRSGSLLMTPDYPTFRDIVFRARDNMRNTDLRKIVISRKAEIILQEPADVSGIFRKLLTKQLRKPPVSRESYFYSMLSGQDDSLFFSLTPETLIKAAGREIRTEALAGSCPPGRGQELLRDGKNLLENSIVAKEIEAELRECTVSLRTESLTLKRLGYIEHLKTPISGILREGISPLDVSRRLHPTPAVLGFPREEALRFLSEEGIFPKSLYGGLGGVLKRDGPDNSGDSLNLAVLLRPALAESRRITLYGGAGILPESLPESEWRETGIKMQAALNALDLPKDLPERIAALPSVFSAC